MFATLVTILHVFACVVLMLVVLLQQGKGGGMGSAFGGASAQVFGGAGAGNILTRATTICAAIFMLTSVTLAYDASSGDRALRAHDAAEKNKKKDRGTTREKQPASAPSASASAEGAPMEAPAPAPAPSDAPKP